MTIANIYRELNSEWGTALNTLRLLVHSSFQQPSEAGAAILLLQRKKLRHREGKCLTQGYAAGGWLGRSRCQILESVILNIIYNNLLKSSAGTSLMVQWLRICLPMQGTRVRSLVGELRPHMLWGN